MAEEKRAYKRLKLREPVQYEMDDPTHIGGCLSRDISAGGIQLRLTQFLPVYSHVNLHIQLGAGRMINCVGRVIWIEQLPFMEHYLAGLEFEQGDDIGNIQKAVFQYSKSILN